MTDRIAIATNKRVKELESLVEKQTGMIERLRGPRFTIPAGRPTRRNRSFLRVIIPDSHGAHLDKQAARAFLRDLDSLKPLEVVWLGDHLDCGGFLAQQHTLGFVPETEYSFEEDVAAANAFLDQVQKRTPKAAHHYIIGNHEQRIEKWIVKETLRHRRDADYLFRMFGPASVLNLAARKMRVVERDKQYDGLRKRGTIKLGKCHFHHGTRVGVNAARANLLDFGANVVFGHTHRIASSVSETANGIIGAHSVGCLCELHPLYGDTNISGWCHGYGLQVVGASGEFIHITVPILNGVSYLSLLSKSMV